MKRPSSRIPIPAALRLKKRPSLLNRNLKNLLGWAYHSAFLIRPSGGWPARMRGAVRLLRLEFFLVTRLRGLSDEEPFMELPTVLEESEIFL